MTAAKWVAMSFVMVWVAAPAGAQTCATPNPTCPGVCTASPCTVCAVNDTEFDSSETGTDCGSAPTVPSQFGTAQVADIGRQVAMKGTVQKRALLHFNLSSLPHNATITSASLHFCVESQTAAANFQVDLWRVAQPGWKETETVWQAYDCDGDGTGPEQPLLWCTPGGDVTSAGGVAWTSSGAGDKNVSILSLVQKAVADTGGHLHMILKATGDNAGDQRLVRIKTREYTADPPTLTVQWNVLPTSSPWVTFQEQPTRLTGAPTTGPEGQTCPGGGSWLTCDRMEKDIATGDFDKDGDEDVVIARKQPFSVGGAKIPILLRNENGVLTDRTQYTTHNDTANNKLFPIQSDARDVFAGDLSGDGFLDLALATTCDDPPRFYRNKGGVGASWQGFELRSDWQPTIGSTTIKRFCAVWGGKVDADARLDLYLSNYNRECGPNGLTTTGAKDVLLTNNIDPATNAGSFIDDSAKLGQLANVAFGTAVEIRDVDKDGDNDIVKISTLFNVAPWNKQGVFILWNSGTGSFSQSSALDLLPNEDPYMFAAGDSDNDGGLDFYVVQDTEDSVHLSRNNGACFVKGGVSGPGTRTANFGGNVKMADIDGDGDLDIGVADVDVEFQFSCNVCIEGICSDTLTGCMTDSDCVENNTPGTSAGFTLLRNGGAGAISEPWPSTPNQVFHLRTYDFGFIDINGDGCKDLFMGLCNGLKVFINTTPPSCHG
jgi:hypothetical protein